MRKELDTILSLFKIKYDSDKSKNTDLDVVYVYKSIMGLAALLEFDPTEDEVEMLKTKIFANYQIKQEEGVAILSDYEHSDWYDQRDDKSEPYWDRYKKYLLNNTQIKVDDLENKTLNKLIGFLGDPKAEENYNRRGLVIGDVQSGKTATYIGLINKAVDAGYKLIILLSGTMENLRKQTQKRVDEGFIGWDTVKNEPIGVGVLSMVQNIPYTLTSTESDYTGNLDKNTVLQNMDQGTPIIFVIKKNSTVLNKLYQGLSKARVHKKKLSTPMLLIDDEADNASINTNKNDNPTKINESIRKILNLFEKSNYVGFTATPFANVFIDPTSEEEMLGSDLFPEDFIFAMFPPSNYVGAMHYFGDGNNKAIVRIKDDIGENYYKHKKDWKGQFPYESFYDAIMTFLLANVIRDFRGDNYKDRTMLINVSRFSNVHYQIQRNVDDFLQEVKNSLALHSKRPFEQYIQNPTIKRLYLVWEKQYQEKVEWNQVIELIEESIKNVYTVVVNSKSKNKLNYSNKNGDRVIAIGGIALSRGLTLEGLIVSYFYRNTSTFDVLMQMGRWFGYRPNYEDICRVFIPPKSEEWYKEIAESIEMLKSDIGRMVENKLTPKQFGIRVRNDSNELGITARAKMRSTLKRNEIVSFFTNVFEAPYVFNDVRINNMHIEAVKALSTKLGNPVNEIANPYFKDVEAKEIMNLLNKLKFSRLNNRFDVAQLVQLIEFHEIKTFDVMFIQGVSSSVYTIDDKISVRLVQRAFDIKDDRTEEGDTLVRISGPRTRVGAPGDMRHGISEADIKRLKEEIPLTESSISSRKYLECRTNPVLAIYFISLTPDENESSQVKAAELFNGQNTPIVSFAIGTPSSSSVGLKSRDINLENHNYVVPIKYDYYKLYGDDEEREQDEARDVD